MHRPTRVYLQVCLHDHSKHNLYVHYRLYHDTHGFLVDIVSRGLKSETRPGSRAWHLLVCRRMPEYRFAYVLPSLALCTETQREYANIAGHMLRCSAACGSREWQLQVALAWPDACISMSEALSWAFVGRRQVGFHIDRCNLGTQCQGRGNSGDNSGGGAQKKHQIVPG